MSSVTDLPNPRPRKQSNYAFWIIFIVCIGLLAGMGWFAWREWGAFQKQQQSTSSQANEHLVLLEQRFDALRRSERSLSQRLQQSEKTNRILRDELLGITQRAALIEDNVAKISDPQSHGIHALRLAQLENLLDIADERLILANDVEGSRLAYTYAQRLLASIDDPRYISLQQTLTQEKSSLEALQQSPRAVAAGRLATLQATLPALPDMTAAKAAPTATTGKWWERWFSKIIDVRPTQLNPNVEPNAQATGMAALRLDITLAHAAIERRNQADFLAALKRIDTWVKFLWPVSTERTALENQLKQLTKINLNLDIPTLGSTRAQLKQLYNDQRGSSVPSSDNPTTSVQTTTQP